MTIGWQKGEEEQKHYALLRNSQQDVTGLCDGKTMNVIGYYTYDAWGNPLSVTATEQAATYDPGDVLHKQPFRYRGYYYDTETGYYYLQSRYYNPEVRRFINADTILAETDDNLGYNLFAYCLNDPVNSKDPSGKYAEALEWWSSSMWWLCAADTALPVGDAIYGAGILLLGVYTVATALETTNSAVTCDVKQETQTNEIKFSKEVSEEEYYDDDKNVGGRQKMGKGKGKTPGDNRRQNKQFDEATRGLSDDKARAIHDKISKEGYGYHEIREEAQWWFRK